MPQRTHLVRLTKTIIDKAEPRSSDYFVWDREMPRFGVRITRHVKTYVVQYRKGGRTRRMKLGRHGDLTLDQARRMAQDALGRVARGADPAEEIAQHRRALTVAALCDRFMAEHVAHKCKPTTQREYRRSVEIFIKPRLGRHKLPDVKRDDIARVHHELRHIPYQANRTLGVLSAMFSLAEDWGLIPEGSNPCTKRPKLKKYHEDERKRFLSDGEYDRLFKALDALEAERSEMRMAICAIRLLARTGCRLSEVQTLTWSSVRDGLLELEDSKTGPRRVYLCDEGQRLIAQIERQPDNPYVFAGRVLGRHITDLQRPWRRIRARAGLPDVRIHDLRHSWASAAAADGVSLPILSKMLGHRQIQSTMRYAHVPDDPLRAAAARVGARIGGGTSLDANPGLVDANST